MTFISEKAYEIKAMTVAERRQEIARLQRAIDLFDSEDAQQILNELYALGVVIE